MSRRAGRGRNALTLQVREALDALVLADPELGGRELDIVDEEHLALAACGKVGKHGASREHVEAAADHGLEKLEPGVELTQLEVESLLCEALPLHPDPDLTVDRKRVEIADPHLPGALAKARKRRAVSRCARCQSEGLSAVDHDCPPWAPVHSESAAGRACFCCAWNSAITASRI